VVVRGLMVRLPFADDGRRQVVSLTPQGDEGIQDSRRQRTEWLARTFQDRFTSAELATVTEALTLLGRLTCP